MNRFLFVALFLLVFPLGLSAQAVHYESNWESLDKRATPSWYDDAKFGIFIHWGVYSVPAFADPHSKVGESYAEWYWNHMQDKNGPTWAFHLAHYGANFKYQDFAGGFKAELFDPQQWADLFVKSGRALCGPDLKAPRGLLPVAVPGELELEQRGRRPAPRSGR